MDKATREQSARFEANPRDPVRWICRKDPLPPEAFQKVPSIGLNQETHSTLHIGVWAGDSPADAFVEYVGECSLDISDTTEIHLGHRILTFEETTRGDKNIDDLTRARASEDRTAGFIEVVASKSLGKMTSEAPHQPGGFQFVLPHRPIRQQGVLRRADVKEIRRHNGVTELRRLLPSVLYGAMNIAPKQSHEVQSAMKAFTLLQLSCQYAFHSVQLLKKQKGILEEEVQVQARKLHLRWCSRKIQLGRKENLVRELFVVDSALDGFDMMAQVQESKVARHTVLKT